VISLHRQEPSSTARPMYTRLYTSDCIDQVDELPLDTNRTIREEVYSTNIMQDDLPLLVGLFQSQTLSSFVARAVC
jgi:hypothetical protein